MTLGVFLIYFLPGNSLTEISNTESLKSAYHIKSSAYKANTPAVIQFKDISYSDFVTQSNDNTYKRTDFYKLLNDNNKIQHFFNVSSLIELKIKPVLHIGFYYFYHPSTLEEPSILS